MGKGRRTRQSRGFPETCHLRPCLVLQQIVRQQMCLLGQRAGASHVAFLQGSKVTVDFSRIMLKRLTHTGSTLRIRDVAFKAAIADALQEKVWPLIEAGKVRIVLDSTFPLVEAAKAHARMETSAHVGKIALST